MPKTKATVNTLTKIDPTRGFLAYQLVITPVVRVALTPVMIYELAQIGADVRMTMQNEVEIVLRRSLFLRSL